MSPPPDTDLTEYKFKQLFEGLERVETAMRDGFAELKRILDDRLASRDERIEKLEDRVDATERRLDKKDGRDTILAWIGGSVGGALIAGVIGLWLKVL